MEELKEQENYYQHHCSICFDRISERAKPSGCIHSFCMECIIGWTKFHNICPLCKVEITELHTFDSIETNKVN